MQPHNQSLKMLQALLKITGRVQGVFYRAGCEKQAIKLGLAGYVRNMPDGSVKALIQGEKWQIEDFIKWAKKGPAGSKIENVEIKWEEGEEGISGFKIK